MMSSNTNIIPDGWKMTTLGEILDIKNGKSRPKNGSKYPVYGGNGVLRFADDYNFYEKTIIVGRVGAYCGSIFLEKDRFWLSDNALGVIPKPNSNIDFLYYLLTKINLNKQAIGGAQPLLTQGVINQIDVLFPESIAEQRAIAAVLSSFDDKIELLRQQNKTLEETAQTIFKEWFVKFNFPGTTGKMIDSELGKIPEGWRVGRLGEVTKLTAGGDKPKNSTVHKTDINIIPIYSNGISNDGLYGYTDTPKIYEESVTISARGTIGYISLKLEPYVPIVRLVCIIPDNNYLSCKYLFLWLKNQNISSTGTTQQQLTIPDFSTTLITIPDRYIMNKFTITLDKLYKKISGNKSQLQTLSNFRDLILPKLMKGKIKVNNF